MKVQTVNYGIKGGMLDATLHLEAAIPRLLNQTEQNACRNRMCLLAEATTTKRLRDAAPSN